MGIHLTEEQDCSVPAFSGFYTINTILSSA
jgi:hypothetical protein